MLVSINYSLHANFVKGGSFLSKVRDHAKAETSVFSPPPNPSMNTWLLSGYFIVDRAVYGKKRLFVEWHAEQGNEV